MDTARIKKSTVKLTNAQLKKLLAGGKEKVQQFIAMQLKDAAPQDPPQNAATTRKVPETTDYALPKPNDTNSVVDTTSQYALGNTAATNNTPQSNTDGDIPKGNAAGNSQITMASPDIKEEEISLEPTSLLTTAEDALVCQAVSFKLNARIPNRIGCNLNMF